jgi:zinc transport system substrate-binding protein
MIRYIFLLFLPYYIIADPNIIVSIAPQKFFVSKIMGDDKSIKVMIPRGSSPATYSPKPSQLRSLKEADIYFTIGVPFEKNWLDRFKSINSKLEFIDTTKGVKKIGKDPHIWLDPLLVKIIVKNIADTLKSFNPKKADLYQTNYEKFSKELDELDSKIKDITADKKMRSFIVYHPSFGYFARRYDLKQIAIEHEGKEPSLKYEMKIIEYAKNHHIKSIFISPAFSKKEAEFIADKVGAKVVLVDHLAPNWDENILDMAKSFEKAD